MNSRPWNKTVDEDFICRINVPITFTHTHKKYQTINLLCNTGFQVLLCQHVWFLTTYDCILWLHVITFKKSKILLEAYYQHMHRTMKLISLSAWTLTRSLILTFASPWTWRILLQGAAMLPHTAVQGAPKFKWRPRSSKSISLPLLIKIFRYSPSLYGWLYFVFKSTLF